MKIFAIRDKNREYAFLYYFEKTDTFYIEIVKGLSYRKAPLIFDAFIKKNKITIDSYWSKKWVKNRVIPSERQNIGQILKEAKMDFYNEYKLLVRSKGKCVQDDLYIEKMDNDSLPDYIKKREGFRISTVIPMDDNNVLLFLNNNIVKKVDCKPFFKKDKRFEVLLNDKDFFNEVDVEPGGFGINWGSNLIILYSDLIDMGEKLPLSEKDFISYINKNLYSVKEASEKLNSTRQNINDLLSRKRLTNIKQTEKATFVLKSEITKREWQ